MSGPLNYAIQPYQQAIAIDTPNGLTASLPQKMIAYSISNINITGPAGTASVYIGSVSPGGLVDSTSLGASNTASYNSPLYVPPGQQVFVVWNGIHSSSVTPVAAFYCEEA